MLASRDRIREVAGDLKVLGKFVETFCRHRCEGVEREPFSMPNLDLSATSLGRRRLCPDCAKLLRHAVVKRTRCPLEPKPSCRLCPVHCYAPQMRERIREVMKFSGRHLILRGRLDLLLHFLERRPKVVTTRDGERIETRA